MGDFASESNHWYDAVTGEPRYTVVGANGKARPTTLRDARKQNLYPSVTSIIRLASAPGLERWKLKQMALACLTLPRIEGESEDAFLERAEKDAQQQGIEARDRGVAIHGAIEQHYRGEYFGELWNPWIIEASGELTAKCGPQQWKPERSYVHSSGYGCKLDLHSDAWIVDTKTKDGDLPTSCYDEHVMQVAAQMHAVGIPEGRGGILFVRRDKPAALLCEIGRDDLDKGWEMFQALLAYHQAKNRYKPGVEL